jgi:SAM-dependent methyltransferase
MGLAGTARELRARLRRRLRGGPLEAVFTDIYQRNAWGSPESVSGPGSTLQRAADFRDELRRLIVGVGCRTLLDAACGDFNWMAAVADAVPHYIGVDVVRDLIEVNRRRHAAPGRTFLHADVAADRLPRADVVLCRDCLVHFSTRDVRAALRNFKRSGATYLVATTFIAVRNHPDIATGEWRPINLQAPPFNFPRPLALLDERCLHSGGIYADKRLGLWRMGDVPG